jgi:membrane peptidoglycan carboxypeptidase
MAGSAIANGGILMKPMLVKNIYTEDGSIIKTFSPEEKKRVISEKTSALMRDILQDVVLEGTAKRAKLDGVGSFGKTGTSYKRVNGRQNDNRHQYASYMGFFPADKPQYGILVMLDDAQSGGDGGDIAAPAFKQIADNIIRYKKTPTNISANNLPITLNLGNWPDPSIDEWIPDSNKVPDLKGLSLKVALQRIVASGGTPRVSLGNKQAKIHKVQSQDPVPHTDLEKGQIIKVITESP